MGACGQCLYVHSVVMSEAVKTEQERDYIAAIDRVSRWYAALPRDFNDVQHLMSARRSLACNLTLMASQIGQLYEQKNATETLRKAAHSEALREAMERPGTSAASAKIIADNAILNELARESQADTEYRRGWILYESWKNICDVMSQHISNLKAERHSEFTGQGSQ